MLCIWILHNVLCINPWLIFLVVYFEKGGDDVHHVRTFAELVTVPDPEILMENIVGKVHIEQ